MIVPMQVEYVVRTRHVVQALVVMRDQTANIEDLAEKLRAPHFAVLHALKRLEKVGRVSLIGVNIWHLE